MTDNYADDRPTDHDELMQRDKVSLDIFWLKDESLEDTENLPDPDVLVGESVENLRAALEQFEGVWEGTGGGVSGVGITGRPKKPRPQVLLGSGRVCRKETWFFGCGKHVGAEKDSRSVLPHL